MSKALVVATVAGSKHLIGAALAKRLSKIKNRRIYIAYGSTNMFVLKHLDLDRKKYYSGFIEPTGLQTNKDKPEVVILNSDDDNYMELLREDDILIKGANALSYEDNEYNVAVSSASSTNGTYGRMYTKSIEVGAEVIIPIGHEKMVPSIQKNIRRGDFDVIMGRDIALLPMSYGKIYTEIDAFKELFNLDTLVVSSGGILGSEGAVTFSLDGDLENLTQAVTFLQQYNSESIDE